MVNGPLKETSFFGQTLMATSRAAWTWGKGQSPLVVGRAGGLALKLGLDLAYKKLRLHVKPCQNVTKYAMALPDHCLTCGRATSQEKALLYRGSPLYVLPPAASSRPRKQKLLVFPVIHPSMVVRTSMCPVHMVSRRVSVFLFPQGPLGGSWH